MRNVLKALLVWAALANGQSTQAESDRRQAILDYQLNVKRANQLITAMAQMTKYVASLPDFKERTRKSLTLTPGARLELAPDVRTREYQQRFSQRDLANALGAGGHS